MGLSQLIIESIRMRLVGITAFTTASGSTSTTTGTINAGSNTLTVASGTTFASGQYIKVAGAGTGGSSLLTWLTAKDTNILTLYDKAITSVIDASISHDDRACVPAAQIVMADGNSPSAYPAIAMRLEGGTGYNFPDTMSGYLWFYIHFRSGTGTGQPTTILNLICDRMFSLLHDNENTISNASIRIDSLKEAYRSGVIPEPELGDYIHSQAIRYVFMAHKL